MITQLEPADEHFEQVAAYVVLLSRFNTRYDVRLFRAASLPITFDTPRTPVEGDMDADAFNVDRWAVEVSHISAPEPDFLLFVRDGDIHGLDLVERKAVTDVNESTFLRRALTSPVAANDNDPDADHLVEDVPVAGLPEHLCYPPGAVGDFARLIVSASRFPSPPLALASSVALAAALVGRRYKGPTGLRSNVYIVGLAESGFGKDTSLRAITHILSGTTAGSRALDKFVIDDASSVQGLAAKLRKDPALVLPIDEFGKWLYDHTGRNAPPHKQAIATALMQLTGATTGVWGGTEKAAGNLPRVYAPCLSVFGVSTPSTFWRALGTGNISEGLLGRMILFDAGNIMPTKVRHHTSLEDIPAGIVQTVEELMGGKIGGNLFGLTQAGEAKPGAVLGVDFAPGVADIFESFDDRIRAEIKRTDPQYRPLLTRVGENAGRLALIVAVGCNPSEPVITSEIQFWANSVAEASLRALIKGAGDNIADNERQAEYLKLRSFIERSGKGGVPHKLVAKHPHGRYDQRQFQDMLESMRRAGEVEYASHIARKGQTQKRWWATEYLPSGAIKTVVPYLS